MKKCSRCLELKRLSYFTVKNNKVLSACIKCSKEYRKIYLEKNREELNKKRRQKRLDTLLIMGNECLKCGFDDVRALQIDHINGGGAEEIRTWKFKGNYNINVAKSFLAGENKYQLLCANCNWIKKYENGETSWKFKKRKKTK